MTFDSVGLGVTDWLVCGALASVVLWADELRKLVMAGTRFASG